MKSYTPYSRRVVCLQAWLLAALMAGCGGDGSEDNATAGGAGIAVAPTVISAMPAGQATDVATNGKITARFSKAMAAKTLNKTSFTLTTHGARAVAGAVSLDAASSTASFAPATALPADTLFTATITTDAQDTANVALAGNLVWTFKTGKIADTIAPTITATDPENLVAGVPTNRKINATFDEPIDAASLNASTFTLASSGQAAISGSVSYVGSTVIFTPKSALAANTAYTATVKSGVKDLAGNALTSDLVWGFTTAAAPAAGPAPVVLGTAGNFAILAKAGVSTTGTTAVTGDIGLSPAAETFITGFALQRDRSNQWSTSNAVTGKLYASDLTPPTPANLTTAVGNMQTAYNDAAGRTLPDATELGAGTISGMTLAPGLYKWSTGLLLASGVTLKGGAKDVWIFQIAQDLSVGSGVTLTLSGGAHASNIFWQVGGKTKLGTKADFQGTILSKTLIALQTGAKLTGRTLAQTAVTLDANAVTQPAL